MAEGSTPQPVYVILLHSKASICFLLLRHVATLVNIFSTCDNMLAI